MTPRRALPQDAEDLAARDAKLTDAIVASLASLLPDMDIETRIVYALRIKVDVVSALRSERAA